MKIILRRKIYKKKTNLIWSTVPLSFESQRQNFWNFIQKRSFFFFFWKKRSLKRLNKSRHNDSELSFSELWTRVIEIISELWRSGKLLFDLLCNPSTIMAFMEWMYLHCFVTNLTIEQYNFFGGGREREGRRKFVFLGDQKMRVWAT